MHAIVISNVCFYREGIVRALREGGISTMVIDDPEPGLADVCAQANVALVDPLGDDLEKTLTSVAGRTPIVGLGLTHCPPVAATVVDIWPDLGSPLDLTPGRRRPRWDRVVVQTAGRPDQPAEAQARIWTRTSASPVPPPLPPPSPKPGEQRERTGPDRWRAAPAGAPDALVLHENAPFLWVCVELTGNGRATPAVRAVRVDYLGTGLPGRLPAVYAAEDADETAYRLVQLLAAPLDELAATVDELPSRFDPGAVPVGELGWLGRWVDQPLDDRRPEDDRRQRVAEAFARHGTRGTGDHLERVLAEAAGTLVRLSEPAAQVSLWRLGESPLGARSMLVPAEALGAIVGTTAVTDGSHLIADEDIGWPLHADVAHRFCVHVMASSLSEQAERELRAVLQQEKPAHTLATVCLTKPAVRVGIGGIGCDLVVGGTCPPGRPHTVSASAVVGDRIPVMGKGDRQ